MAWMGYYTYAGTEIINVERVENYARWAGLYWFKPAFKNDALGRMLSERYESPLQDDAPWTDPDDSDSYDFFGLYPLSVSGIEDSTATGPILESTRDGGLVGRTRRATRPVVFTGVLLAASECGAEYGMRWLRTALSGGACFGRSDSACGGSELCYLSCEPFLPASQPASVSTVETDLDGGTPFAASGSADGGTPSSSTFSFDGGGATIEVVTETGEVETIDLDDCLDDYIRTLRNVTVTNGPIVTQKMEMTDGSVAWSIQFTATAGNPVEFGPVIPYVEGFMDPAVEIPFVGGVVPSGAMFDPDGFVQDDPVCAVPVYTPVVDPLCPAVIPPPAPPSLSLSCFDFPVNYLRRQFTIPKEYVPLWGEVVPVIKVHARDAEARSLRLRFYADVTATGDPNVDPCAYCGDIVFSYVPRDHTLVFDAADRSIYVESATTGKRRADSLVFKSDGTPFEWPELSCGFGYIVTLDLPQTQTAPVVDMSLIARVV